MDHIGDFITRIRNGLTGRKIKVTTPYTKINYKISKILIEYGFITSMKLKMVKKKKENSLSSFSIELNLKYYHDSSVIKKLMRISKPSKKVYWTSREILNSVKDSNSMYILSTSHGIVSHIYALEHKIGGEVLILIH
jgi:small subunit ribosomal protein S8